MNDAELPQAPRSVRLSTRKQAQNRSISRGRRIKRTGTGKKAKVAHDDTMDADVELLVDEELVNLTQFLNGQPNNDTTTAKLALQAEKGLRKGPTTTVLAKQKTERRERASSEPRGNKVSALLTRF